MNFMRFVAQDLREYMARLGVRTVTELVGRTDFLKVQEGIGSQNHRVQTLVLDAILNQEFAGADRADSHFDPARAFDFHLDKTLDETVLLKKFDKALKTGQKQTVSLKIGNVNRAFGTLLGAEITRRYSNTLPDDTMVIEAKGSGGQSIGAFIPRGLTIRLEGECNDHVGKGLSGGKIIVFPPKEANFAAEDNILIGNVALYGATGGKLFVNGIAGERFCVRNSGATAVVEGVGNHGCEYMTGGIAVILGETGKNFAAGMSGGVAYVLDEKNQLYLNLNPELVNLEMVTDRADVVLLKELISEHTEATGSEKGRRILAEFDKYIGKFRKVMPREYKQMMLLTEKLMEEGMDADEARREAFYTRRKEVRA